MSESEFLAYRGLEGLYEVREFWESIFARMNKRRYFHLFEWHEALLRHLEEEPDKVSYYVYFHEGEPLAILPLKIIDYRILGLTLKALSLQKHPHSQLGDLLVVPGVDMTQLMRNLQSYVNSKKDTSWDMLLFPCILADSNAMSVVKEAPCSSMRSLRLIDRSNYMLCCDYEKTLQRLSKKFRRQLRRDRDRMTKIGNVRFVSSRRKTDLLEYYTSFLDVEASGWKGEQGTGSAIKLSPKLKGFYQTLIESLSDREICEINLLVKDDSCISAQYCLVIDGICYVLKIGYDETYKEMGPGHMLREAVLKKYQEHPEISTLSMVSSTPWHERWRPNSINVYRGYIFNRSWRGAVGALADGTRSRIKRAYKSLCVK